jgi:putative transposase
MDVSEARRLRDLEGENNKLKKLLAEAHLDIEALKTAFGVKR